MFNLKISEFRLNVASGVVATIISSILQFVLAPILLFKLGAEVYGIWATLSILMVVGAISDQGLGDSLTRSIARASERKAFVELKEYLTAALIIAVIISLAIVTVIFQLSELMVNSLNIPPQYSGLSVDVVNSLAIILVLYLCQVVLNSLIIGVELIRFKNYIFIFARLVQFIFSVVFLYAGYGIWSLIYAQGIFQIISIVSTVIIVNKKNKHSCRLTTIVWPNIDVLIRLKEIVKVGSLLFVSRILMLGLQPLLRAVLAREFGMVAVAYFDIANRVVGMLKTLFLSAAKVVLPMASQSGVQGLKGVKNIIDVNRKFLIASASIGGLLMLTVFLSGDFALRLWLGEQYNETILLYMKIIVVSLLLNVTILSHYNTLIGWGYTNAAVLASLFSMVAFVFGLIINGVADYAYGAEGVLFAYVLNYLVGGLYVYLTYSVKLKEMTKKVA